MEEMRLRHYEAAAAGKMDQAVQEAQALWQDCVKQMDLALNDLDGAAKYVIAGANEHPNRLDICAGKTGPVATPATPATPFGQSAAPRQPAAQPSAFGQPSTLGQPSAFGQPGPLRQGTTFGQPSTLGGGPSGLAQAGANRPAFGQTGFGQPSAPSASPFGQIQQQQQPQQPTPFGQPSAPAAPFGAPPQQPAARTGFGQPSGVPGFGQPTEAPSPFGQVQQQPQAKPTPFAKPSTETGAFGKPGPQQAAAPSPFGPPAAPEGAPVPHPHTGPRAFLKIDEPDVLNPLPALQGETKRDPKTNKLTMWKGRPVKYIKDRPCYLHPQDNKTWIRIFFPDGPPDDATLRDVEAAPEEYTPEVEAQYKFFNENGYFKDGIIPSVPPKKEWNSWDF